MVFRDRADHGDRFRRPILSGSFFDFAFLDFTFFDFAFLDFAIRDFAVGPFGIEAIRT
jgi:hypothetical protein